VTQLLKIVFPCAKISSMRYSKPPVASPTPRRRPLQAAPCENNHDVPGPASPSRPLRATPVVFVPGPACNRLLRSTLAVFIAEARKRITTKMHTRATSDSSRGKRVVDNKFNSRTPATCLDYEQRLSCSQYRRPRPRRRLCWYPCCQRRSRQPQPSAGAEIHVTQRRLGTRYVRVHCFSLAVIGTDETNQCARCSRRTCACNSGTVHDVWSYYAAQYSHTTEFL